LWFKSARKRFSGPLMITGSHLPFPGLGHVAKALSGYVYAPTPWGEDP
jgi:hypothetical protein